MENPDYSMYTYYKGSEDYPNKKAAFFGYYERGFEMNYKGKPEDKEDSFKDFISDVLYGQISEIAMFGVPGVDKDKKYREYIDHYLNPEDGIERHEKH